LKLNKALILKLVCSCYLVSDPNKLIIAHIYVLVMSDTSRPRVVYRRRLRKREDRRRLQETESTRALRCDGDPGKGGGGSARRPRAPAGLVVVSPCLHCMPLCKSMPRTAASAGFSAPCPWNGH
jgi:hypothetical protein